MLVAMPADGRGHYSFLLRLSFVPAACVGSWVLLYRSSSASTSSLFAFVFPHSIEQVVCLRICGRALDLAFSQIHPSPLRHPKIARRTRRHWSDGPRSIIPADDPFPLAFPEPAARRKSSACRASSAFSLVCLLLPAHHSCFSIHGETASTITQSQIALRPSVPRIDWPRHTRNAITRLADQAVTEAA